MCGRFALHSHPDIVKLHFGLKAVPAFQPRYNIAPAADVPIVRSDGATLARWQLAGKYHNLRADTVTQKPFWAQSYRQRRCLIPASGFYEWQQRPGFKQPFYARPGQGELFAFAGLWERWRDQDTCAVITTEANGVMRAIHDRMPVIVSSRDYSAWLDGEDGLLRPPADEAVSVHAVGEAVNRAAVDSPSLIDPLPLNLQRQGATGELFGD
jgi:putative SOS response-associated peptidase YedK